MSWMSCGFAAVTAGFCTYLSVVICRAFRFESALAAFFSTFATLVLVPAVFWMFERPDLGLTHLVLACINFSALVIARRSSAKRDKSHDGQQ